MNTSLVLCAHVTGGKGHFSLGAGIEPQRTSPVTSPVAPALRSEKALDKIRTKRTEHDAPVHSFATIAANRIQPHVENLVAFTVSSPPRPRFSARSLNCWASRTVLVTCSHVNPPPAEEKGQVTRRIVHIAGGNFSLTPVVVHGMALIYRKKSFVTVEICYYPC